MKNPESLRLLLVRHGESTANAAEIYANRDTALSDKGHQQAMRIARRLSRYKIDKIIISTYTRAKQTAEHIINHHKHAEIIYDKDAREHELGVFEGKRKGTMEEHAIKKGIPIIEYRPQGGESIIDLRERARRFLDKYRKERGTILIIAHGTFIKALLQVILEFPDDIHHRYGHDNASLTIVDLNEKKLKLLNCTKHLKEMKEK